jgi:hypothetical protein
VNQCGTAHVRVSKRNSGNILVRKGSTADVDSGKEKQGFRKENILEIHVKQLDVISGWQDFIQSLNLFMYRTYVGRKRIMATIAIVLRNPQHCTKEDVRYDFKSAGDCIRICCIG